MKTKNVIGVLLMVVLCQQAFSQTLRFTLKGKLNMTHPDSVLLYYDNTEGQYLFQSRPVFNDSFIINDSITRPIRALILFKTLNEVITEKDFETRAREIYLEPGLLTLSGDPAKINELKLTGSNTQYDLDTLNSLTAPIRAEMQPLMDEYNKEKDPEKAAVIGTKFEPYEDRIKAISYRFFLTHPNSYITADQMVTYVNQVSLDSSRRIYNLYNDELKQSYGGRKLAAEIKKMEDALPGKMAVGFEATDIDGNKISLADYKDKYLLLDFWASWCGPCREGNPHLVELFNKYKSKGLNIVSIADDDTTPDAWKNAIAKDGLGIWPNVLSGSGTENDLSDKYAIHFIPTKILVDPEGKIIGRFGDNNNSDVGMDRMLASIFEKIPDK
ncbi:MAG: TlpA family protein disulfide reductase [Mucilaginibacter sp.]